MTICSSLLRRCLTLSRVSLAQRRGVRTALGQSREQDDNAHRQQREDETHGGSDVKRNESIGRRTRVRLKTRDDDVKRRAETELAVFRRKSRGENEMEFDDGVRNMKMPTISELKHEIHQPLRDDLLTLR